MRFSCSGFSPRTLALSTKTIATLLSVVAIYFQDLTIVVNDALRSDLTSYILAIPFLSIYLIYRKRKMLGAAISFETAGTHRKSTYIREVFGTLLCLLAFLLYWHGSHTFYPLEYHLFSLPIFAAGLVLIIFNAETLRVLAFPVAFLLFLTPPPTEMISIAGASVATFSSDVSCNFLKTIGLPVSQITAYGAPALIVTDPSGSQVPFVIGTASSGIYSVIGFTVFTIFIAYIARGPVWKKATLLLASLPLIYTLNITRIILLISMGHWQGVNVAWDVFHLLGGPVLVFLGTIILLLLSEKIWKIQIIRTQNMTPCHNCNPTTRNRENYCLSCGRLLKHSKIVLSKLDLSKIVAITIFTSLIVSTSAPVFSVFALTEDAAVLIQTPGNEQAATTQVFPEIHSYSLSFVYRDTEFERIAPRERALLYKYKPTNTSAETVWIALEIGSSRSAWHSWEVCLITWPQSHGRPPQATQLHLQEIQLLENPPLKAKFFTFQPTDSNNTQVVLYWYESAIFSTNSGTEQKYIKISLIAFPRNEEDITETENILQTFGVAIAGYWQPIRIWSTIALTIAQNGHLLITIPTTLLATILAIQTTQKQREKKANLKAYNKLISQQDKHILKATHKATKIGKPTTHSIATQYQQLSGKTISLDFLTQKLREAEKADLIKCDLASQNDEPILVWRSRLVDIT